MNVVGQDGVLCEVMVEICRVIRINWISWFKKRSALSLS